MIVYLSGAMEYANNDGEKWRKELTIWLNEKLNHNVIDPVYYYNKPIYLINKLLVAQLSGWIMSCATEIFDDFDALKNTLQQKFHNAKNRT